MGGGRGSVEATGVATPRPQKSRRRGGWAGYQRVLLEHVTQALNAGEEGVEGPVRLSLAFLFESYCRATAEEVRTQQTRSPPSPPLHPTWEPRSCNRWRHWRCQSRHGAVCWQARKGAQSSSSWQLTPKQFKQRAQRRAKAVARTARVFAWFAERCWLGPVSPVPFPPAAVPDDGKKDRVGPPPLDLNWLADSTRTPPPAHWFLLCPRCCGVRGGWGLARVGKEDSFYVFAVSIQAPRVRSSLRDSARMRVPAQALARMLVSA